MSTRTEPVPLADVIEAIRPTPETGRLPLAVTGELLEGVRCRAEVRGHELARDEPFGLGGTDTGANRVETALAALSVRLTRAGYSGAAVFWRRRT